MPAQESCVTPQFDNGGFLAIRATQGLRAGPSVNGSFWEGYELPLALPGANRTLIETQSGVQTNMRTNKHLQNTRLPSISQILLFLTRKAPCAVNKTDSKPNLQ